MSEVKQPIESVTVPSGRLFLITDKHSVADIVRWLDEEGCAEDAYYLLEDLLDPLTEDEEA